ncbi:3-oxoadipate enol-lactone hydrolase family domain protein [Burkholderia pseudomallei MSHR7504]|nr:3-oxoadipate enol-lactone hydrolase family domain protein [Burkholderia pseudomallei MSHR7504]
MISRYVGDNVARRFHRSEKAAITTIAADCFGMRIDSARSPELP